MDFDLYKRIHTSFKDVSYYDDVHAYYSNGIKIPSVTTVKKKFFEPFDKDYWAVHEALKRMYPGRVLSHARRNIPNGYIAVDEKMMTWRQWQSLHPFKVEMVHIEWDKISKTKRERGTEIHRYLELGTYGKFESKNRIKACDAFLEDKSHHIPLALELVVATPCRRICGQLDRLSWDPVHEWIELSDFKTDEKLSFDDPYGKKMKAPFDFLPHTEGNGYIVQLNLYAHCLESIGVPVGALKVYNILEKEEKYIEVDIPKIDINIDAILNDNQGRIIISTRGAVATGS